MADIIIIFSKDVDEHIYHVDNILTALKEAAVILNLKTFRFFSDSFHQQRHFINPGRL